jgi:outer membrane murein-binding lipoprotein Lpp
MFGRKKRIKALETKVEELEAKVAELEAKRVPVLSDLTGGGKKEKPVTAKQIMDEWFNGKAEGGEGK